ncbi:MAG: DUF4349 domain-containing protein [Actinomycetota bacterium]
MTQKRWIGLGTACVLLLIFTVAMVLGCGGEIEQGPRPTSDETLWYEADAGRAGAEESVAAETKDAVNELAAGEGEAIVSPGSSTLPQMQLKVIKTALMEMDTEKGGYARIREDALAIAAAAGGYVEGESASRDDEGFTYATLTLRIPADRFDEVAAEVADLGEVVSTQVSTNDVTAEYVDMESRLKHLQAEESFYMSLIAKAQTIQEMITIREHLDSIQLEKEQVQGRMNFLDQQVGYSTITLSVDETGPEDDGEGFWASVGDAFRSFGRGMGKLAVGFFYALPYLLIVAAAAVVAWLLVRRARKNKPGESTPPDV